MKIALCQINPTVGSLENNYNLIKYNYESGIRSGADLIIFPELAISGYPPQDLLFKKSFIDDNIKFINQLASESTTPMIIGYIRIHDNKIFNSACLCINGKIVNTYDKILLPTYDVFDEDRYFSPGKDIGIWNININEKNTVIGIQICEDIWDDNYDNNIIKQQKNMGADFIVNISASPFSKKRLKDRISHFREKIREVCIPIFYCNLIGAQDELVFDGCSMGLNGKGECIGLAKSFENDILLVDIDNSITTRVDYKDKNEDVFNALCLGVKDYFIKTGMKKAVVGISGGIDSAVVTSIATFALGKDNVQGVMMPSKYSSNHSIEDAKQLAENLGINYMKLPIQSAVAALEDTLIDEFSGLGRDIAEENIQARVRGNLLMALSNKFGWIVLSTGNKTELALGYCTLYGDMSGGLAVISDLNKTDVYDIANWINNNKSMVIPENSISKLPSAELSYDQVDPFDYNLISPLVDEIIKGEKSIKDLINSGFDSKIVLETYNTIIKNEYKRRQAPIGIRVTNKAFGNGRRFPIVNHYKEDI